VQGGALLVCHFKASGKIENIAMEGANHTSQGGDAAIALAERGHFVWAHIIKGMPVLALAHQANLVRITPYTNGEEATLLHPFCGLL
jgi:hypothetical protein